MAVHFHRLWAHPLESVFVLRRRRRFMYDRRWTIVGRRIGIIHGSAAWRIISSLPARRLLVEAAAGVAVLCLLVLALAFAKNPHSDCHGCEEQGTSSYADTDTDFGSGREARRRGCRVGAACGLLYGSYSLSRSWLKYSMGCLN